MVQVCRKTDVRFSITARQHKSLRNLIEAIPEADWPPIPYWMQGATDVAETEYASFQAQGPPERPASPPALALGDSVRLCPGAVAGPAAARLTPYPPEETPFPPNN